LLESLRGWKKLTAEQKKKHPDELVNLLDKAAGLKGMSFFPFPLYSHPIFMLVTCIEVNKSGKNFHASNRLLAY